MQTQTFSFATIQELEKESFFQDSPSLLIQLFCANAVVEEIKQIQTYFAKRFPQAVIIGTTTDGIIENDTIYVASKHVVTMTHFETTSLTATLQTKMNLPRANYILGEQFAKALIQKDTKVIIAFSDGLHTNGEEFLRGISDVKENIPVAGGMAADNGNFQETYVFDATTITNNGAVGVALHSKKLSLYTDYMFDWQAVGKEMRVTKAIKNRVYEIDGMSAVDVYAKYMGEELAKGLPQIGVEFPLVFEKDGVLVGRAVLAKHEDGSLSFAGNIKEGTFVRFAVGNIANIVREGNYHFEEMLNSLESKPEAIYIYSCMARRRFMQEHMQEELKMLHQLGEISGFFTYGEFYHAQKGELLNETMTILALSENETELPRVSNKEIKKEFDLTHEQVLAHLANSVSSELAQLNKNLQKRVQESTHRIYEQAYFDKLTGVPNRLSLLKQLDNVVEKTIYLLNIDDFATINDFYGYKTGDKLLVELANLLQIYVNERKSELFKLPADEFVIISSTIQTHDEIVHCIETLVEKIATHVFAIDEQQITMNLTVGVAFANESHTGLAHADMAFKRAKAKNTPFEIYKPEYELTKKYQKNIHIANELREAIENDNILPYFQPIIDTKTDEIVKYESLVRLIKQDGTVLAPFFFLEISEKIKLYDKITKIMIEKSFSYFSKKQKSFSINLSFLDILNQETQEYLFKKIKEYDVASLLTIEILETEQYSNAQAIKSFTEDVYAHGATIAIDDFGSGFANFEHMTKIASDFMKIDGSLIKNLDSDKNARLIVETIISFAQKLGKKTIAEYVHSEEIYEIVKELGIDYAQGYYFSEPKEDIL